MIYTFTANKGGTGKTTTAAALAQAAAYTGKKTLAIDLDPQGNLTFALAADAGELGSYELLHGAPAQDLIQHTAQGLDAIPASRNLLTETTAPGSARRLQEALRPVRGQYDYIFIDTPATAGELQYNALQAAQRLIIPLEADSYCIQSLYQTMDALTEFKKSNSRLKVSGVILTKYDSRPNVYKYYRQVIEEKAAAQKIRFLGTVRKAAALCEAVSFQESLYKYAPRCNPAIDYMEIFNRL